MATEQSAIGSWDALKSRADTIQWGDTMDFSETPCSIDGTLSSILYSETAFAHPATEEKMDGVDWDDIPFSPSAGSHGYGIEDPGI